MNRGRGFSPLFFLLLPFLAVGWFLGQVIPAVLGIRALSYLGTDQDEDDDLDDDLADLEDLDFGQLDDWRRS